MSDSLDRDELEAQIARTRTELAGTVDALTDKLDVKSQAQHAVHDAGRHLQASARRDWPALAVLAITAVALVVAWRRL